MHMRYEKKRDSKYDVGVCLCCFNDLKTFATDFQGVAVALATG
jgi:hypothetical protein